MFLEYVERLRDIQSRGKTRAPLIFQDLPDVSGRVVAVVCLKADLSGASFATPAEVIRAFFEGNAEK